MLNLKNKSATPPYKQGFTLAEVLITLVIIGVIAAMTVPTLINKTNNQEYVSKLKKAYSTLAQATNLIIAEEGTPRVDKGGWATSGGNIYNLYKKHLVNAKECGSNTGCWQQSATYGNSIRNNDNAYNLVLADGTQVYFDTVSEDCSSQDWSGSDNVCASIHLDINGAKKPNKTGRDVFIFVIKEQGLYPAGCEHIEECTDSNRNGTACACKVLREGAMNY
ncbi:type II secretion system protein [bacterium]|nr:type II secretion system protein [bacterium]